MGAIYIPDLRSDVTHMIVGDVNTPKYQVPTDSEYKLTGSVCSSTTFRSKNYGYELGYGSLR
jgi:twin BRCT domain